MATKYNAVPAGFESDDEYQDYYNGVDTNMMALEDIKINACINGNFDATLESKFELLFKEIREYYVLKKWEMLKELLKKTLMAHSNPLLLALKLFANCPDNRIFKFKSLSFVVLETACKLQVERPHLSDRCDENISLVAFHFTKKTDLVALKNAMIRTYRLRQIRHLLVPKLREMLDDGYWKEANHWIISLQLTDKFDMMELAFPLVAQGKVALAEEYLDKTTNQRLPFIQFLDSLLHNEKSVIALCEQALARHKNLKISYDELRYRPISKMVARFAQKYGFDETVMPNYKYTKTVSHLHYLFHEYENSRSSLESFRELVWLYANDYALQLEFVNFVARSNESEAIYWFKEFKLLNKDCPYEIKSLVSDCNYQHDIAAKSTEQTAAFDKVYLSMDLPDDKLIMVDTADLFEQMLLHLQQEKIIYIDTEWMSYVCAGSQLCLMQIATKQHVYLIDCLARQALKDEHWRQLGTTVFNNEDILKIGYALLNDLTMMKRALPLQLRLQSPHRYLDLYTVWLALKKNHPNFIKKLPYGNMNIATSGMLTDVSKLCLGKKLNKTNQSSNWTNRPLRREQLHYAALDARCLLLIYNCLINCIPDVNEVFEKCIASSKFVNIK